MSLPPALPTPWTPTSTAYRVACVLKALIPCAILVAVLCAALLAYPVVALATQLSFELHPAIPFIVGGLVVMGAASVIVTSATAFTLRYRLLDDEIGYRCGWFSRTEIFLPYERVQTITLHNGMVDRLLGISNVVLQSAADQSNITIPGLRHAAAEATRQLVLEQVRLHRAAGRSGD